MRNKHTQKRGKKILTQKHTTLYEFSESISKISFFLFKYRKEKKEKKEKKSRFATGAIYNMRILNSNALHNVFP